VEEALGGRLVTTTFASSKRRATSFQVCISRNVSMPTMKKSRAPGSVVANDWTVSIEYEVPPRSSSTAEAQNAGFPAMAISNMASRARPSASRRPGLCGG